MEGQANDHSLHVISGDKPLITRPTERTTINVPHEENYVAAKKNTGTKNEGNATTTPCLRCKKDFEQAMLYTKLGKLRLFKLCLHCRELQRHRLARWQKKTKEKGGACRRCGTEIDSDEFVLCLKCRQKLRHHKAQKRAEEQLQPALETTT